MTKAIEPPMEIESGHSPAQLAEYAPHSDAQPVTVEAPSAMFEQDWVFQAPAGEIETLFTQGENLPAEKEIVLALPDPWRSDSAYFHVAILSGTAPVPLADQTLVARLRVRPAQEKPDGGPNKPLRIRIQVGVDGSLIANVVGESAGKVCTVVVEDLAQVPPGDELGALLAKLRDRGRSLLGRTRGVKTRTVVDRRQKVRNLMRAPELDALWQPISAYLERRTVYVSILDLDGAVDDLERTLVALQIDLSKPPPAPRFPLADSDDISFYAHWFLGERTLPLPKKSSTSHRKSTQATPACAPEHKGHRRINPAWAIAACIALLTLLSIYNLPVGETLIELASDRFPWLYGWAQSDLAPNVQHAVVSKDEENQTPSVIEPDTESRPSNSPTDPVGEVQGNRVDNATDETAASRSAAQPKTSVSQEPAASDTQDLSGPVHYLLLGMVSVYDRPSQASKRLKFLGGEIIAPSEIVEAGWYPILSGTGELGYALIRPTGLKRNDSSWARASSTRDVATVTSAYPVSLENDAVSAADYGFPRIASRESISAGSEPSPQPATPDSIAESKIEPTPQATSTSALVNNILTRLKEQQTGSSAAVDVPLKPEPEPEIRVESMDAEFTAVKNSNLREKPTTKSGKIGFIAAGTVVRVTGKVTDKNWYRIAMKGGKEAFVFVPLLSERKLPEKQVAVGVFPNAGRQAEETFKDCAECPEMMVIPPGQFRMGDPSSGGYDDEKPVHAVTIGYKFAVGKYEVTFDEWDACLADGGCGGHRPNDAGLGRGRPVIYVSWDDAKAYVRWLSGKTGQEYRLLSEAEWEYAARAGTTTAYNTGSSISKSQARYGSPRPVRVGSYSPNAFGLYDVHGNVWEWTEDCWNDSYFGAPGDGSAWLGGACDERVLRGGDWTSNPTDLRLAFRYGYTTGVRNYSGGFRVARSL